MKKWILKWSILWFYGLSLSDLKQNLFVLRNLYRWFKWDNRLEHTLLLVKSTSWKYICGVYDGGALKKKLPQVPSFIFSIFTKVQITTLVANPCLFRTSLLAGLPSRRATWPSRCRGGRPSWQSGWRTTPTRRWRCVRGAAATRCESGHTSGCPRCPWTSTVRSRRR